MKALDLTETSLQKNCSINLPLRIERVSLINLFIKKPECIIIGDLRKIQHVALFFFFKKVIIVDDGMISISIIKSDEKFSWINNLLKRFIIKKIIKLNSKKITYYSIFIEKKLINKSIKLNFIPNKFSLKASSLNIKDDVLLVGMDLVDLGIVSKNFYEKIITNLIKNFKRVYYYPHRSEIIKYNFDNLIYLERSGNIEEFIFKKKCFKTIISFYSTSLVILNNLKIHSIDVYYIKIPSKKLLKYNLTINDSYAYLKNYGIKEYKLNSD